MKTILLSAYAINPYKGSEDGTGWNIVFELSKYNKVIAITRENNQEDIERYIKENHISHANNLQFEYFDLPYYLRFWKKKSRGALLYFYLWQISIIFFILKKKFEFDITHNLNFHSDWTPSFLWVFKKPFVWGPVGHHPKVPKNYLLKNAGIKAYLLDRLKWYTKKFFWNFDPFLQITKRKAEKIIAINSSVAKVLSTDEQKIELIPAVATRPNTLQEGTTSSRNPSSSDGFTILSVGRFVPLKGFDITIAAFAKFYHLQSKQVQAKTQLILIGKGPEEKKLKSLARNLNVENKVIFISWISKEKLNTYFLESDVFLFPSHEGAGMVVPEALSFSLPVLCFDNYGPGEFINKRCGIKIPYSTYEESVQHFAQQLNNLFHNPQLKDKLSKGALKQYRQKFTWERKGKLINKIYNKIIVKQTLKKVSASKAKQPLTKVSSK